MPAVRTFRLVIGATFDSEQIQLSCGQLVTILTQRLLQLIVLTTGCLMTLIYEYYKARLIMVHKILPVQNRAQM